ncbi:MAG: hypothetical protein HY903_01965 [Deltaproteobacteria bacterium]|nr:hypothetical protein [Deltaproteobacteria bacterium]
MTSNHRPDRRRRWLGVAVLCPVALLAGCSSSKVVAKQAAPVVTAEEEAAGPVLAAERAYTVGNASRAMRLAERVGPLDPQFERASDIFERSRFEVESVALDWIDRIDLMMSRDQYPAARERARYLLAEFPIGDDLRAEVETRLKQIDEAVVVHEQKLAELDRQATDQLLRYDLDGAQTTLREAEGVARSISPERALARERAIAAIQLRIDQRKAQTAGDTEGAKASLKARRAVLKKRRPGERPSSIVEKPAEPPPAAAVPASDPGKDQQKVQDMLREATGAQKARDYYKAILAFEGVRRLDAKNEAARVALEALEPKRQALIKDNLAKANSHFLKQDLAGAVPFFKKVRELDPKNQEAREGLEMYENLERIRGNAGAVPPR